MGVEQIFLTKVLETGDLQTFIDSGLTPDVMLDRPNRLVLDSIMSYFYAHATRGSVPSKEYILAKYDQFEFEQGPQKMHALCEELKLRRLGSLLQATCTKALPEIAKDPVKAYNDIRTALLTYQESLSESRDVSLATGLDKIKDRYKKTKEADGVTGIPWPWDSLTEESLGMQPGELIIWYGRHKTMKTWMALYAGVNAYLAHDKRVLVFTWEMPPEALLFRAASIMAGIDYRKWRKSQLSEREEAGVFCLLDKLRDMEKDAINRRDKPSLVVCTTVGEAGGGVVGVRHKIEEYMPDLVVIDGVYNMRDDRDKKRSMKWHPQANIIRDVQQTANDYKIPIIVTTQANRTGEDPFENTSGDLSFTDTGGMFCDYMIKNYKMKEEDETVLFCQVKASRDFTLEGFKVEILPSVSFNEVQKFHTDTDMLEAIKLIKDAKEEKIGAKKKNGQKLTKDMKLWTPKRT